MFTCTEDGCGSTTFRVNHAGGHSYCAECGTVYDENDLINSVQFTESKGSSGVVGTYVKASGTRPYPTASGSQVPSAVSDSREISIQNALNKMRIVANQLHMASKHVDTAHRLYRMAAVMRFTQGRKINNVIAACLFITARQVNLPIMLLDISDAVRVNVFELGQTFLQLFRMLNLGSTLHVVDPALFITKYAERLNLGNKKLAVTEVAIRITAQMNRDWIQTGRRPAGVCAVALQIACNIQGIDITRQQICKLMRIGDSTVGKRMHEFEQTPSCLFGVEFFQKGGGAPSEFNRAEGDNSSVPECDPPSFITNRIKDGTLPMLLKESASQEKNTNKRKLINTYEVSEVDESSSDDDECGVNSCNSKVRKSLDDRQSNKKQKNESDDEYGNVDHNDPLSILKHTMNQRECRIRKPSIKRAAANQKTHEMIFEIDEEIETQLVENRHLPAPSDLPEIEVPEIQTDNECEAILKPPKDVSSKNATTPPRLSHIQKKNNERNYRLGNDEVIEGVIGEENNGEGFENVSEEFRSNFKFPFENEKQLSAPVLKKNELINVALIPSDEKKRLQALEVKAQNDLAAKLQRILDRANSQANDKDEDQFAKEHLLPDAERKKKEQLWKAMHQTYVDERKRLKDIRDEELAAKPRKKHASKVGSTAEESVRLMSQSAQFSSKINWEVICRGLNSDGEDPKADEPDLSLLEEDDNPPVPTPLPRKRQLQVVNPPEIEINSPDNKKSRQDADDNENEHIENKDYAESEEDEIEEEDEDDAALQLQKFATFDPDREYDFDEYD